MTGIIVTFMLFVTSEAFVNYIKNVIVNTINQFYATAQMEIETGYHYMMYLNTINTVYAFVAIAIAVLFSAALIFQIKRRIDNEENP